MNIKVVVFALVMTASMGAQGESWFDKGYCSGYIIGVSDTADTLAVWKGFAESICTPQGVTSGQLQKVVVKHLNEHPEKLHLRASSLVLNVLTEAFPCE